MSEPSTLPNSCCQVFWFQHLCSLCSVRARFVMARVGHQNWDLCALEMTSYMSFFWKRNPTKIKNQIIFLEAPKKTTKKHVIRFPVSPSQKKDAVIPLSRKNHQGRWVANSLSRLMLRARSSLVVPPLSACLEGVSGSRHGIESGPRVAGHKDEKDKRDEI